MSYKQERAFNYLVIMPRFVDNVGDGYSFPLGIAYISGSLKHAGFNVFTLNLNHEKGRVPDILARVIKENEIDAILTGSLSFQYNMIRSLVESAKKIKENIITIVGGGIITSDPETAMTALEYVDYGIIGEAEITVCELCEALDQGHDVAEVKGLIYAWETSFFKTEPRKEMENINSIPWPDYEGFNFKQYLECSPGISGLNNKNTIFMIASRSCPYLCTFCFHTVGRRYRQRHLDNFFEELEHWLSKYDIEYLCLADELFARDLGRVKEFCARIKKYNLPWWAQFRVDDITPELLMVLKDGGCDVMSFGLESADNRVLKSMRKGTTVEKIEKTLKIVYDTGISFEGAFIFGDIEEDWETAQNTLAWWREHSEYKITLNLITIYPGSYLYQYACKKGIIKDKVQFLRDGCPQVNISKLNDRQYSEVIKTIMEAPFTLTKKLDSYDLTHIDYERGRIDAHGKCTSCKKDNDWTNIKLFAASFLSCKHCGQRYNIALPQEFSNAIESNMKKIIKQHGKVAVWGINYHSTSLFKNLEIFKDQNVLPVDISSIKQKVELFGKQVLSPDIITQQGITAVVIAIPVYYVEIEGQIKNKYPEVQEVFDICQLVQLDAIERNSARAEA